MSDAMPAIMVNKNAAKDFGVIYPQDLPYIRPSQVDVLRDCPTRWVADTCLGLNKEEPVEYTLDNVPVRPSAAEIGTAMHMVIEACSESYWLKGIGLDPLSHPASAWIKKPEEKANLVRYIDKRLFFDDEELIALELTVDLEWHPDMPPVHGHVDQLTKKKFASVPTIVITDHKSNRGFEPREVWRNKAQPLLYAAAIRKMYPGHVIIFRIGYINLNVEPVEWECREEDEQALFVEMREIWSHLLSTPQQGPEDIRNFRRTVNAGCTYCQVKSQCPEFKAHTELFDQSTIALMPPDKFERYNKLKLIAKLVDSELSAAEAMLAEDLLKDKGKPVKQNGQYWFLDRSKKREINFWDIWPTISEVMEDHPELRDMLVEEGGISVKMAAVDKMIKASPRLAEVIEEVIHVKPADKLTVKSSEKLKVTPVDLNLEGLDVS